MSADQRWYCCCSGLVSCSLPVTYSRGDLSITFPSQAPHHLEGKPHSSAWCHGPQADLGICRHSGAQVPHHCGIPHFPRLTMLCLQNLLPHPLFWEGFSHPSPVPTPALLLVSPLVSLCYEYMSYGRQGLSHSSVNPLNQAWQEFSIDWGNWITHEKHWSWMLWAKLCPSPHLPIKCWSHDP